MHRAGDEIPKSEETYQLSQKMKNSQRGFTIPLLLVIVALLLAGGTYMYMQKNQENPPEEYQCPDVQKLDYEKATDTYIRGVDCMPSVGGDPFYFSHLEQWVNTNCGIKFKTECVSY